MRRACLGRLSTCLALILLGCNSGSSNSAADAKVARAQEEIKRAAEATAEAAAAKRDQYAEEMRKQLKILDAKTAELRDQAARSAGETKKDLEKKLEEAKSKHTEAAKQLEDLQSATDDRWEKLKSGVGKAVDDLKKVVE